MENTVENQKLNLNGLESDFLSISRWATFIAVSIYSLIGIYVLFSFYLIYQYDGVWLLFQLGELSLSLIIILIINTLLFYMAKALRLGVNNNNHEDFRAGVLGLKTLFKIFGICIIISLFVGWLLYWKI
jgi:hypothetical protein